ncbi:MAG: HAMP domain-containing protein, partial [Elusimicrobiota bacterium]
MKLKTRLSLFTIVIIVLVIFTISFSVFVYEKRSRINEIKQRQKAIYSNFTHIAKEALLVHDELLLLSNMKALKNTYKGIEYINFLILDEDRVLYTDNFNSYRIKNEENLNQISILEYKGAGSKAIYEITGPVFIKDNKIGVSQIGYSKQYYNNFISDTLSEARNRILLISLISLSFGLFGAIFISSSIAKPIKKLAGGVKKIGEGVLSTRINLKSSDEVERLA